MTYTIYSINAKNVCGWIKHVNNPIEALKRWCLSGNWHVTEKWQMIYGGFTAIAEEWHNIDITNKP